MVARATVDTNVLWDCTALNSRMLLRVLVCASDYAPRVRIMLLRVPIMLLRVPVMLVRVLIMLLRVLIMLSRVLITLRALLGSDRLLRHVRLGYHQSHPSAPAALRCALLLLFS